MNPNTLALIDAAKKRHEERLAADAASKAAKIAALSPSAPSAAPAGKLSSMMWGTAAQPSAVTRTGGSVAKPVAKPVTKPTEQWAGAGKLDTDRNIVKANDVALVLSNLAENKPSTSTTFNPEQKAAIELGLQGKSFCLIGAAGTGKTTVTQELIKLIQRASHLLPLSADTKHLKREAPGIVICGYTNKAVNNIRKRLPPHLQAHCITIHKLLEYQPEYYEVPDSFGGMGTTMRFEPSRNSTNPLPHISTIIFEESSMIGTELHEEVLNALPYPGRTQFVYLGDLNQLPPVFGPSILGFKLAELQTIELTHVYRQALQSPIISLATSVRTNSIAKGFKRPADSWEAPEWDQSCLPWKLDKKVTVDRGEDGILHIHPWKKRVESESALHMMKTFLPNLIESGAYNPAEDMILCPFNKSFGTVELNNIIADYLGKKAGEEVFEVIARYQKTYWAVGDRVLVDRHEAVITRIVPTPGYYGKAPQMSSKTLNRWGVDPESPLPKADLTADEVLNALDSLAGADDDAKNLASHTITVYIPDLDKTEVLNTAGGINSMLFGWCLTVHKSQGSEWQRVFLFLHNKHATMLSRELVYTAVTRAKHELYIICEGDIGAHENSLVRAAARPIVPGVALQDKIAYFRGKLASQANSSAAQDS